METDEKHIPRLATDDKFTVETAGKDSANCVYFITSLAIVCSCMFEVPS